MHAVGSPEGGYTLSESGQEIECAKARPTCTLTAQSGASVVFHFVKTPDGPKQKRVDLPAEGD